jgi:hypothetical protein
MSMILLRRSFIVATNTKTTQKKADEKRRGKRTRNYATIVYPESAPPDWIERLKETHVQALISPLHEHDVNPDGEPKKPHYHVLLIFGSVKTLEQAQEVFAQIGGVGQENVLTLRGYARYLCHIDNPEKAQYDAKDVISIGGLDYYDIISLPTDKYELTKKIVKICHTRGVEYFDDLLMLLIEEDEALYRNLHDNSFVVREFLSSRRAKKRDRAQAMEDEMYQKIKTTREGHVIDPVTGEIIGEVPK